MCFLCFSYNGWLGGCVFLHGRGQASVGAALEEANSGLCCPWDSLVVPLIRMVFARSDLEEGHCGSNMYRGVFSRVYSQAVPGYLTEYD